MMDEWRRRRLICLNKQRPAVSFVANNLERRYYETEIYEFSFQYMYHVCVNWAHASMRRFVRLLGELNAKAQPRSTMD